MLTQMKRHPVLIPISREHHQVLLLAQLLKKDAPAYRGLPSTREGKIHYASQLYQSLLKAHLWRDRQVLFPYLASYEDLAELSNALIASNSALTNHLEKLSDIASEEELDTIGRKLESYVRIKERQLFEQAQQVLNDAEFADLQSRLEAD